MRTVLAWFSRLRTQLLIAVTALVVISCAGTIWVAARTFLQDKRSYILELNSAAVPNIAASIARYLADLEASLATLDDLIGRSGDKNSARLIESVFRSLRGVEQLSVYDRQGLLARLKRPSSEVIELSRVDAGVGHALRSVRTSAGETALVFLTSIDGRRYEAVLSKAVFLEHLEPARALSASVVGGDGVLLLSVNDERARSILQATELLALLDAVRSSDAQAVVAREIQMDAGERAFAAAAKIPGLSGVTVVAYVPATRVEELVGQVFSGLVPVLVAILVLTLGIAVFASAQIVRPLEDLKLATSQIASGDWDLHLPRASGDEIGSLIHAFERMGGELARRENALKRAHEDLLNAERLATLGKFGAGLAHEVKNPLNAISGFAQLLARKPDRDETERKYVQFILDEARRASRIISDLLTFARQRPLHLARVDLGAVVATVQEVMSPQAKAAGVSLVYAAPKEASFVDIDREQIQQVLVNLVDNAIHALQERPERGDAEPRRITMRLASTRESVRVEIEDNGPGIKPENLARIFEPFFTTKGVGKGTGLGLALCHGIMNQHRGRIDVRSRLGEGTTFVLELPAAQLQA